MSNTRCRRAAPKETESRTSYIYCDYCGQYVGLDFFKFLDSRDARAPGPEFSELTARLQPKLDAALAGSDRGRYIAIQRQIYAAHMEPCPASYSPRIGDSEYRQAMLDFLSERAALTAFDPKLGPLKKQMDEAIRDSSGSRGRRRSLSKATFWTPSWPRISCRAL